MAALRQIHKQSAAQQRQRGRRSQVPQAVTSILGCEGLCDQPVLVAGIWLSIRVWLAVFAGILLAVFLRLLANASLISLIRAFNVLTAPAASRIGLGPLREEWNCPE